MSMLGNFIARVFHTDALPRVQSRTTVHTTPLPCPLHGATLIPEQGEQGSWDLYCPICRAKALPTLNLALEPVSVEPTHRQAVTPLPALSARRLKRVRFVSLDEIDWTSEADTLHLLPALKPLPRWKKE